MPPPCTTDAHDVEIVEPRLQADHDLEEARRVLGKAIERIERIAA